MKVKPGDPELIEHFVASWAKLDDPFAFEDLDPVAAELCCTKLPAIGGILWRPLCFTTPRSDLSALYTRLPAPFPPLYELLILSYRWAQVDLRRLSLLPNPPGLGLSRLETEIYKDRGLARPLLASGFVQFGRASGGHYDPVCFDARKKRSDGDYRVVRLDHEAILCHSRIREVAEIAPSYRDLVSAVIDDAQQAPTRPAPASP